MKKKLSLIMILIMVMSFTACVSKGSDEPYVWTLEGYFTDENNHMASVTYMEDIDESGWYVNLVTGWDWSEDSYGGMLAVKGNALQGVLQSSAGNGDIHVVVFAEGENGLMVKVRRGETYHFKKMDIPEATIFVGINTEGNGNICYEEGEKSPEIDEEYPYQSATINLYEPATVTILAWPHEGSLFVKWTKDGEDYSTEPQITVLLDESVEYTAVFEPDEDYKDPVEPYAGEYRGKEGECERATAVVFANGDGTALINISWSDSASSERTWVMSGKLDTETMTIKYDDCYISDVTYNDDGERDEEAPNQYDGTGTIQFNDNGTLVWNDDQDDNGDLTFIKITSSEE